MDHFLLISVKYKKNTKNKTELNFHPKQNFARVSNRPLRLSWPNYAKIDCSHNAARFAKSTLLKYIARTTG